eukprot:1158008-Pelagomonas_calceolata.AAC.10
MALESFPSKVSHMGCLDGWFLLLKDGSPKLCLDTFLLARQLEIHVRVGHAHPTLTSTNWASQAREGT